MLETWDMLQLVPASLAAPVVEGSHTHKNSQKIADYRERVYIAG